MRLAAVSVFFATFAVAAWALHPAAPPEPGFHPVGNLPPSPSEPEPPPVVLDPDQIAFLNDCANDPDLPRSARAEAVRLLVTEYLRPPADFFRVRAVLRDPRWLADAEISRVNCWCGSPIGKLSDLEYPSFWVHPFPESGQPRVAWLVRVSGPVIPTVADFRAFLSGDVTRVSVLVIEEFAWQDGHRGWGVEHYDRLGRRR